MGSGWMRGLLGVMGVLVVNKSVCFLLTIFHILKEHVNISHSFITVM